MNYPVNLWRPEELVQATGGTLTGHWPATLGDIAIHSQTVETGSLFVAAKGPRHDGHAFIQEALARGAGAVLASFKPASLPDSAPVLVVPRGGMAALWDLAVYARHRLDRSGTKVIALTGSTGKTTTRFFLHQFLETAGPCFSSPRNYNNHWGVPFTLVNCPPECDYLVLEMGMNAPGELRTLTHLARPHMVAITNISEAHLERFESIDAIGQAKAEILEGLGTDGTAVLPRDDPRYAFLAERTQQIQQSVGSGTQATFGTTPGCDHALLRADTITDKITDGSQISTRLSTHVSTHLCGHTFRGILNHTGPAAVENFLCAALMGFLQGVGPELLQARLPELRLPPQRGELVPLETASGYRITVMDDSYNASPASMKAALNRARFFAQSGKVVLAVLGDMLELGPEAESLHAGLAEHCTGLRLFLYGQAMRALHGRVAGSRWAAELDQLEGPLQQALSDDCLLVLKASRGMRAERVYAFLR